MAWLGQQKSTVWAIDNQVTVVHQYVTMVNVVTPLFQYLFQGLIFKEEFSFSFMFFFITFLGVLLVSTNFDNCLVNTESADVLVPHSAKPSAGTVLIE